jgi:N-acetylneuraminic acid mutarotase
MYAFNNVTAGWQPRAPIPFQANHMSFVTAKDGKGVERHFFVGGQEAEDEESGNIMSHYEYDASLNVWTERQPLPFPRGHTSSSTRPVSCGYIMIGGTTNGWSRVPDVSFYGIDTNTWTKIGELPFGINTPVCDINRATNMLYCESGGATFPYSHKRQMVL